MTNAAKGDIPQQTIIPDQPSLGATVPAQPERSALGGGAYEAAARLSKEMASWIVRNGSADADLLPNKEILDARSKDIARNDAYVDNGIEKYKDSVVGARFSLNANPNIDYLTLLDKRFDYTWMEEFQAEVEAKYGLSAESNSNWFDAQRKKTATEMIRLGLGTYLIQGEVLYSSEWIRRSRRPFNTAYLMIDPTRLDDPGISGGQPFTKNIRKGVRQNANGEAVGYFIANEHPHDYYPMFNSVTGKSFQYTPKETPWGRMNILHVYEEKRIGQTRGVSKLASALKEMKMTKSFRDVMLQNAIVNATYAAAIESELPTAQVFEIMGGDVSGEPDAEKFGDAVSGYTAGFLGALAEYMANSNGTMLNGVRIPHLFPGTKLNMLPAGQGGPLGTEFEDSLLRYLAAAMGISFEQLTGNFTGINYSTLKGAINETQKHMNVVKRNVAERIANFMYTNWLEEQIVNGQITSMPRNHPSFWEGLNREAYSQAQWFNSGRGQIDEAKETQAAMLRLKSNITTYEEEMGRLGLDWRQVILQKSRENAFAERHGVNLSFEDNALNAASGTPREPDDSNGGNNDE